METENTLPRPTSLSRPIVPPINSVSRLAMASPSPVPPNRRVVDASACENDSKIRSRTSSAMPMPVSLTSNLSSRRPFTSPTTRTVTPTSPLSVNFTAFDTRFRSTWRSRPGSPTSAAGNARIDVAEELDTFSFGRLRHKHQRIFHDGGGIEFKALEIKTAGLNLRVVEDVVDQRQQTLAAQADGRRVGVLFRVERRVEEKPRHPDDAVERRPNLVAHVRQEFRLRANRRLRRRLCAKQLLVRHLQSIAFHGQRGFGLPAKIVVQLMKLVGREFEGTLDRVAILIRAFVHTTDVTEEFLPVGLGSRRGREPEPLQLSREQDVHQFRSLIVVIVIVWLCSSQHEAPFCGHSSP